MAASSVATLTKIVTPYNPKGKVKIVIAWQDSAVAGEVPDCAITTVQYQEYLKGRNCVLGLTKPGGTPPTASYDVTVIDEYGADVFGGELLNRSQTVSEQAVPKIGNDYSPRLCAGVWTIKVAGNSVANANGTVVLYFE